MSGGPRQPSEPFTEAMRRAQQQARVSSSHVGLPAHPNNAMPRSGIQPDASGQVICPFCRKAYHFTAALLNRQLRCSGCRSTFRVAEDRRTFKVQAATALPTPDTGSVSAVARQAIKQANVNLAEAAEAALRAISKQDRPAPPGSETALRAATPAIGGKQATRSFRRNKAKEVVLTGEGAAAGRRVRAYALIAAGLLAIAVLTTWLSRPDPRQSALVGFQQGMSFGRLAILQRANALVGGIAPMTDLGHAAFSSPVDVDLGPFTERIGPLRVLRRGEWFVEPGRRSEAVAMLGEAGPAGSIAFAERCAKAGIRVEPWGAVAEAAGRQAPGDGPEAGVLRSLLEQREAAPGTFDALATLDAHGLPSQIQVSSFRGADGTLLLASGPPRHPVAYQGRLIRFHGPGWPEGWMVFEIRTASTP